MGRQLEYIGEQITPPPEISPRRFLTDVAPVLDLSAREITTTDKYPFGEKNAYDPLVELVDTAASTRENGHDPELLQLAKVMIRGFQEYENLGDALYVEGYIFKEDSLPSIVEFIANWMCENLVEVAVSIRHKRQPTQPKQQPKQGGRRQVAVPKTSGAPNPKPSELRDAPKPSKPSARPNAAAKQKPAPRPESGRVYQSPLFRYRYKKNGHAELLTAEEEVELGKIIEAGVLAEERLDQMGPAKESDRPETKQLREDLQTLVQEKRRAFDFFVAANDRWAWKLAYRSRLAQGLEREDIKSLATGGLMQAVRMFDYTSGYKFSTYSGWWIHQYISKGIADTGRNIRLPVHVHVFLGTVARVKKDLRSDLGRHPTEEEVAKELGLTPEELARKLENTQQTISLDEPLFNEVGSDSLLDRVDDPTAPDVFIAVDDDLSKKALKRRLRTALTPREQLFVWHIMDGDLSVWELSETLNMPIPTVHRSIRRARAKLTHPSFDLDSILGVNGVGEWRHRAICRSVGYLDFFSLPNTTLEAEAQASCGHCPAAAACLAFALESGSVDGIWGGTTGQEREAIFRRQNTEQIVGSGSDRKPKNAAKEK